MTKYKDRMNGIQRGYWVRPNPDNMTVGDARRWEECHRGYYPIGASRVGKRALELLTQERRGRQNGR